MAVVVMSVVVIRSSLPEILVTYIGGKIFYLLLLRIGGTLQISMISVCPCLFILTQSATEKMTIADSLIVF